MYIDGGISNPVPDNIVKKMGADIIFAIDLNGIPRGKDIKKVQPRAISDILLTSVNILSHHLAVHNKGCGYRPAAIPGAIYQHVGLFFHR